MAQFKSHICTTILILFIIFVFVSTIVHRYDPNYKKPISKNDAPNAHVDVKEMPVINKSLSIVDTSDVVNEHSTIGMGAAKKNISTMATENNSPPLNKNRMFNKQINETTSSDESNRNRMLDGPYEYDYMKRGGSIISEKASTPKEYASEPDHHPNTIPMEYDSIRQETKKYIDGLFTR